MSISESDLPVLLVLRATDRGTPRFLGSGWDFKDQEEDGGGRARIVMGVTEQHLEWYEHCKREDWIARVSRKDCEHEIGLTR